MSEEFEYTAYENEMPVRTFPVGSTNLNSRSLHYDYEINAFILDLPTTAELGEVFQNDKLNSTIMTREEYKKRSVWRRFVGWFAHLFTPVI